MLNVDVANKPAVKGGPLIKYMETFLAHQTKQNRLDLTAYQGKAWDGGRYAGYLQKDLKGLKIRYVRPDGQKREWRCNKVMDVASKLKFDLEGKMVTVEQYFKSEMKYTLNYPLLPCLHLGSLQKNIYIPVELLELKPQSLPQSKKLGDIETAEMIKKTAVTPTDRKKRIEESLKEISNTFKDDKFAQEFGISVESVMSQVQARVYQPPSLAYADCSPNAKNKQYKFRIPEPGGKWDMLK